MKYFLRFVSAFVLSAAVYYSIITHVNYGLTGFSVIRLAGFVISGFLFFLAIRNIPWIIRLTDKMRLNRIERHGILVMAFLLSVAQFVLTDELSSLYHNRLLDESSKLTTALVVDCEDDYCDCRYEAEGQLLEQKFQISPETIAVGDTVHVYYHQSNPNIFRLADSAKETKSD